MKHKLERQGFTLVELLVTIAIIAILAGILLPTVVGAFKKASEAQARTEVKSLETAIKQYLAEYGKYPLQSTSDKTYSGDNKELMNVLRGVTGTGNENHANNPRRIVFIEVAEASLKNDNFIDPWENPYLVAIDYNFDNQVTASGFGTVNGRTVLVWSKGVDPSSTNSLIKSW